ncbi:putative uroporphyrinogen III C-methyltransferase [Aggregatibacter actinomycetemcomitans]|uniref:uroporphyrinogen-III C-methyltransferase n=1 Tax=Aggregatibacter actinomycetemcomitans TaxID=714 RepID=UPI0001B9F32D|nr:uroporphyrinogen-III C-methyltransferase [Aggregatibacter actinomycetemcomitans]ACX82099.1 HemX protein [Aggregatibacter actinomycetemcomitans D11S-1]KOE60301.1 HemX protein [Aggregatibacter actinomycetemcomitans serotype c str. SCC2302]KOE61507.1 HemX protein [Aggregatibacter actinomycetemcomitans serotype c str. AAS4A]KOE62200.1 HemX protein [Aggregatibacter actinomycetemcomitans serotype c str. D17P-2]KYK75019.1 HemX protein [Aggregatibacter actinomycetemcomitans serotype e str. SA2149]
MANKKSNHPKNNAGIEHKIDVSDDLDLATQDTTPNEHVETNAEDKTETMQQSEEKIAPSEQKPIVHETVVVKKTGSALGLLALLIALGLGGAGYYFGQLQVDEIQQKLTALESQLQQKGASADAAGMPDFSAEKNQLAKLTEFSQVASDQISALNQSLSAKEQSLSALQQQVQRLSNQAKAEQPNDWLLTEADFLLNNALRKLVLDNDVDTSVSLLKVADETLSKVAMPQVAQVRSAINADLKQLLSLNNVDQNAIMQNLSQLANNVDELTVLDVNFDEDPSSDKLTDSLDDWKENAEKSAVSFLNHFIRITPKKADSKALLAPNQDIYLRENIRLRLQIAILAVPRQQDDLYKQSLETVASWIRSYFDTNTEVAQIFLKTLDELAEQSIYVDVPTRLNSLNALDKLLDKQPQEVQKITLSVDKDLTDTADKPAADKPTNENEAGSAPTNEANQDSNQGQQ